MVSWGLVVHSPPIFEIVAPWVVLAALAMMTVLWIRARNRQMNALHQAMERFRSLVEATSDFVWEVDEQCRYTYASPKIMDILGYSPEEMLGKTPFHFMSANEARRILDIFMEFSDQHKPFSGMVNTCLHKQGRLVILETSAVPIFDAAGTFRGYRGIDRDITMLIRTHEELKRAEQFAQTVLNSTGMNIAVIDREGTIIAVNEAWDQFARDNSEGKLVRAGVGVNYLDVCRNAQGPSSEEAPTALNGLLEVLNGRRDSFDLEYPCHSPTQRRWFLMHALPMPDRTGVVISHVDVTQLKLAEETLRESDTRFHQLAESVNEIFWIAASDWKETVYVSPAFERIFGRPLEIIYRNPLAWIDAIFEEDRERVQEEFRERNATGFSESASQEFRIVRPDGSIRWICVRAFPIRNAEGRVYRIAGTSEDVTQRKQAEEEIRSLNQDLERRVADRTRELEAANEELEAFAYSVSHDLRAPLRAINGFTQMIREDYSACFDNQGRELFDRILQASHNMAALIEGLLKLSRLIRTEVTWQPVHLSEMAQRIAEDMERQDPGRHVVFTIEPNVDVRGDPVLLHAVLENLFGNAWKFTARAPSPHIEFGSVKDHGHDIYFVRDNGAGFDQAQVDRLFTPFARLHRQDEFPGTGIGLATVRRIIHRHGGRVWAEGELGHGATFFFTLEPATLRPIPQIEPATASS